MFRPIVTFTFSAFAAVFAITCVTPANADLVLVFRGNGDGTVAELTNSDATGDETFTLNSFTGDGTPSATYTYTIGTIDAAGDGTANDSLTATFGVAAGGGNVTFQNDGNFGVSGNGAGNLNDASESLTFSLVDTTLNLGDPGSGSVTGGGFNQIQFTLLGDGESATLTGTDVDGTITGSTTFANTDTFTIGHTDDGSSFRVGPARYRFAITAESVAVPEPSSVVLFGMALAFGASKRRRRVL